ncbi:MAG: cyclophilin family peptidyl-prolyl cis-trans isomerase, partial [Candidatus Azotimanducaceae bacterium]
TFIHRSDPGFILQTGGFTFSDGQLFDVPTDPPIQNEYDLSNIRGTLAMAKLGGDPNSATSQWFINLGDNSENLDNQNGGFTVFARVLGEGMVVADAISNVPIWDAGGALTELPLLDFQNNQAIAAENIVFVGITLDSDDDGAYDDEDAFPQNPLESVDTDMDGTGNNADLDDDADGLPDAVEIEFGLDPLDSSDAAGDLDNDGFSNLKEYEAGTDMADPLSNTRALVILLQLILGGDEED